MTLFDPLVQTNGRDPRGAESRPANRDDVCQVPRELQFLRSDVYIERGFELFGGILERRRGIVF